MTPLRPDASPAPADAPRLRAEYFDGRSAAAWPVRLSIVGDELRIERDTDGDGDGTLIRRTPLRDVAWPERTRHGARLAHLRDGGTIQALDAADWDAWVRRSSLRESMIVTTQQSWRGVLIGTALLVVLAVAGYVWGVPWAARAVLVALPAAADRAVGDAVLNSIDDVLLLPSRTPVARQQALRMAFAKARHAAGPAAACDACDLQFRTSAALGKPEAKRTRIGPNAFALPGGTIVVTDEMLELLTGRDDILLGVLGHELGHVQHRHGMRLLVQAGVIGAAATVVWGDLSTWLAAAPALLGQSAYSRDFEREADAYALVLLRSNDVSPIVMSELFERLAARRPIQDPGKTAPAADAIGIALASHPADAERMQFFRDAANGGATQPHPTPTPRP